VISDEDLHKKLSSTATLPPNLVGESSVVLQSKDPRGIITNESSFSFLRGGESVLSSHFLYGVMTRFNAVFRGLVQDLIRDFRASQTPVFHPNMTCVAVHVRRDDRALSDTDMIDWCRNHTVLDKNGQMKPSGFWIDGV